MFYEKKLSHYYSWYLFYPLMYIVDTENYSYLIIWGPMIQNLVSSDAWIWLILNGCWKVGRNIAIGLLAQTGKIVLFQSYVFGDRHDSLWKISLEKKDIELKDAWPELDFFPIVLSYFQQAALSKYFCFLYFLLYK